MWLFVTSAYIIKFYLFEPIVMKLGYLNEIYVNNDCFNQIEKFKIPLEANKHAFMTQPDLPENKKSL